MLGTVAAVVIATPFAAGALSRTSSDDDVALARQSRSAVPTDIAKVVLASLPDVVIPLSQLTGFKLPDLHVRDLQKLELPASIAVPDGADAALAQLESVLPTDAATPIAADELPPDIANKYGTTVKEVKHDSPFSMVAVTANDLTNTDIRLRAKKPDGTWSEWFSAENLVTTKVGASQPGTEPIYVGETDTVQLVVSRKTAAVPTADPVAAEDLNVELINPGSDPADNTLRDVAQPIALGGPRIVSRAQWGADESIRCQDPILDDFTGGGTVHHTAGNNDYSPAESAGIVRAIYTYHATTLGWCDIGYNALVDKYGQIFEGRAGGLNRPVQGAHAGGFNQNTVGVAMIGDFETVTPTDAAIEATGQFLGWRLKLANLAPKGRTKMYSEGTEFTQYPQGAEVDLPVIFTHRDVGNTTCPGDAAYAQMDRIRDIADRSGAPIPASPGVLADAPHDAQVPIDIPGLIDSLLKVSDENPIARAWAAQGGADGPLGQALSGLIDAAAGQVYTKFTNGYVYSVPGGEIVTVVGPILQKFIELGLHNGVLGLPMTNEYSVPDGVRMDFEHGSLVLNQITGFVQQIIQTYEDSYADAYNNAAAPAAPLVDAAAPAPEGQAKPALKIPTLEEVAPERAPVSAPAPERPQTNESIVPVG